MKEIIDKLNKQRGIIFASSNLLEILIDALIDDERTKKLLVQSVVTNLEVYDMLDEIAQSLSESEEEWYV